MYLSKLIPECIKEHLKLIKLKKIYGERVCTHMIGENVILGKEVFIAKNCDIRNNVIVDDYSYINRNTLVSSGRIGKYCSIGYNCQIGIFEHPTKFVSTSPSIYRHGNIKNKELIWPIDDILFPTIIENDVWIGSNVIIKQGVKVGSGSIIGAGSVVTKNIEPYSIVGGTPAKLIRKRFSNDVIDRLLEISWWEKDEKWISENIDMFLDVNKFIYKNL